MLQTELRLLRMVRPYWGLLAAGLATTTLASVLDGFVLVILIPLLKHLFGTSGALRTGSTQLEAWVDRLVEPLEDHRRHRGDAENDRQCDEECVCVHAPTASPVALSPSRRITEPACLDASALQQSAQPGSREPAHATPRAEPDLHLNRVATERARLRLKALEALPEQVARTIEMVGDRVAVLIYDKEELDEEDILAANLLLFGKSDGPRVEKAGPRWFVTPGPIGVRGGGIAVLDDEQEDVVVTIYDAAGKPTQREMLTSQRAKLRVGD